jgi:phosphoglycerate dehydrogenase-like enzyme
MQMTGNLRVAMSGDFLRADGSAAYPEFDVTPLQSRSDIDLFYLPNRPVIGSDQVEDVDALIISDASVSEDSFHPNGRLAVIARFGVGYDKVDVESCSHHAVALVITPDGVRRPVAVSILTLILALTGRLVDKAQIARQGPEGWARAVDHQGTGLVGKTLGSIGLGNIGAEMFRLAAPLGMRAIATDPYADPAVATDVGVELCDLDTVISQSDILAINCPLMPSTRHLMNADRLALMKPTAYLINTARGGIVDQAALTRMLRTRRIAGAGLDVLDPEPPSRDDPILSLDNVIITPHSLCWTDQLSSGCAKAAVASVLTTLSGREPRGLVNREILHNATWRLKLDRFAVHERGRY